MAIKKKIILVGIDYTKSSENALRYALMLAKKANAGVLIFHMYEVPVVHTFSGAYFVSYSEMQDYNLQKLEKYRDKFAKMHKGISIEVMATYKNVKEGVKELIRKHQVNYVVMGLDSGNKVSKFIFGTTGLELVVKISAPVIIVPESYKKHHLKNGILALDNTKTLSAGLMKRVNSFNRDFGISKEVVHVKTEDEFLFVRNKTQMSVNKKWRIKIIESDNFEKGILLYVKKKKSDMISVVSHSHSVVYNLFKETNTKKLAFKSKVPVMSIHD